MARVQTVEFTVRTDDSTLTLVPVNQTAAMALIESYVPETECLTFNEAFALALMRDEQAAAALAADCEDADDGEPDEFAWSADVNRELETASMANDAAEA